MKLGFGLGVAVYVNSVLELIDLKECVVLRDIKAGSSGCHHDLSCYGQ